MSERKINGTIVRHCRDEFGEMIVTDDGVIRSLYFGDVLQSSIRLDHPAALIDEYNQAMMSSLIFREDPRSVLIVGLGGCSLVNFLVTCFPSCTIDAVEIREMVVDLARSYFLLRRDHANLNIFHASGQDFVFQNRDGCGMYDLIIVDAFDEGGPAARLLEKDFLLACRQRLGEDGVFAMNLWSRPKDNFPALYCAIREAFGENAMKLAVSESCWNTIVFGFAGAKPLADLNMRRPAAKQLQQKHGINFPKYLKYLYWQNFG
jgi:spermidine synthase